MYMKQCEVFRSCVIALLMWGFAGSQVASQEVPVIEHELDNVSSLWYSDEARRGCSVRIFGRGIPVAAL